MTDRIHVLPASAAVGASLITRQQVIGLALLPLYIFVLVSRGGLQLFGETPFGLVFNAMAINLVQGRLDIDPTIIGVEAYIHDGRSYAYFGIFPALLRLPLLAISDITQLHLSRLSLWLALSFGALAQAVTVLCALRHAPRGPTRQIIEPRLLLAAGLSGPPVLLVFSGTVFDESIAWAWALAAGFCALGVHGLTRPAGFTSGVLTAMAALAGCSVLTRPTTGVGLSLALTFLIVALLFEGGSLRGLLRRALAPRVILPTLVLMIFALITAGINHARWGDPFSFGDLRMQLLILADDPSRIARIERHGYFNLARLPYGLIYYFFPIWSLSVGDGLMFEARIRELFDGFELPPASFLVTDALTLVLAAEGAIALLRRRPAGIARGPALSLIGGLCFAPALMLVAWYMAFRYRVDFAPVFFTLACLGAAAWVARAQHWPPPQMARWNGIFAGLLVVQFVSAHIAAILYSMTTFGSAHDLVHGDMLAFYKAQIARLMNGG